MASISVTIIKKNGLFVNCVREIECTKIKSLGVKDIQVPLPPPIDQCDLVINETNPTNIVQVEVIKYEDDMLYIAYNGTGIVRKCIDAAAAAAGTGGTIVLPSPLEFEISNATLIKPGDTTTILPTGFQGFEIDFLRDGTPQSRLNTQPSFYSWNKITREFITSPAASATEIFKIKLG